MHKYKGEGFFIRQLSPFVLLLSFISLIFGQGFASAKTISQSSGFLPVPPDQIISQASSQQIVLHWKKAGDVAGFRVYRSYTSGKDYELVGQVPASITSLDFTFTDTSLINRVIYYYVISSFDSAGFESTLSKEIADMPNPQVNFVGSFRPARTGDYPRSGNAPLLISVDFGLEDPNILLEPGTWFMSQVKLGSTNTPPAEWITKFDARYAGPSEIASLLNVQAEVFPGNLTLDSQIYYVFCFSTNAGLTWTYYDLKGKISNPWQIQPASNLGVIHYASSISTDVPTQPDQPWVSSTGSYNLFLNWSPSMDLDGLTGYDIYRADSTGETPHLIASTFDVPPLFFQDTNLKPDTTYSYIVKAIDNGYTSSPPSQSLEVTTKNASLVDVTIQINVPAVTPGDVFINRNIDENLLPADINWQAQRMQCIWAMHICSVHLQLQDGIIFPFTLSRGNPESIQTLPDGNTPAPDPSFLVSGSQGLQTIRRTVYQWDDPLVVQHSPSGAIANHLQPISVVWNQNMPPASEFAVYEKSGSQFLPLPGKFGFGENRQTIIFYPENPLKIKTTYRVSVSGQLDLYANMQQTPFEWIFTTAEYQSWLPVVFK